MNWNAEKIRKRSIKYILFLLFSFLVGNTFLAYIIGTDRLWALINEPVLQHIGSLSLMIIFTLVFFFVYVWFREQVCLVVCPYGRMQGVLLDKKSIVVTYDHVRGEPRHKAHKGIISGEGDCIDCKACVHVCPTGIDIRNGTQLECVNCTACIDACNHIMDSINLPQGLIRYDSEEGVQTNQKWKITPRMIGYSVILLLIVALEITLLTTRSSMGMSIIRAKGTLFTTEADGSISNLYNIKLINKTEHDMHVELKLKERVGAVKWIGKQEIIIPAASSLDAEFFLTVPANAIPEQKNKWKMECWSSGKKIGSDNINFIAPHR
jgi:cytochrome c oxidase accessory protein FixG